MVKEILSSRRPGTKVKAKVIIINKNLLGFKDFNASLRNRIEDLFGKKVELRLVSSTVGDPNNGNRGMVGPTAYLKAPRIPAIPHITATEKTYKATFVVDEDSQGIPGAVIVRNTHKAQFFLKSITIENFLGRARIHFDCNSWVYRANKYSYDRIFFANHTYVTEDTPTPLIDYRSDELRNLRGDEVNRKLEEWDRVYNYAYYNDLGNADVDPENARPTLGGAEHPYPRRGKTGRPPSRTDPNVESPLPTLKLEVYVPRDERYGHKKFTDFLALGIKTVARDVCPKEFRSLEEVLELYKRGLYLPDTPLLGKFIESAVPFEFFKNIITPSSGQRSIFKLPVPHVIQNDKCAWRTDEEFAREMLAGANPLSIQRLREFPPTSKLDQARFGQQNSTIKPEHIKKNLDGLSVQKALDDKRLFILDHHDTVMPYLREVNVTDHKVYATRTLLFLKPDGTLKPLAIELSLPHPGGDNLVPVSTVYTPASSGVEGSIWTLAKAYVNVNDSCIHQLISHWLRTHAVIEPFVIATNRRLSAMHPINKLLVPHYRDTMNINSLARQALVNAGGLLEDILFPSKHAMKMSSDVYKSWNFVEQGLPSDLIMRGMAEADPTSPHRLRLMIEDYPYAVDGLAIWEAIEKWVRDYCGIYYSNDDDKVRRDGELQAWWKEVREVGHGDLKQEAWWPEMAAVEDLIRSCTTIIWVASAMHAAVNFGQYPYAGYYPNRPTVSRQLMPEVGSAEYQQLQTNPDNVFLSTITSHQTIIGISLIEVLSTHTSDEVYLGQRISAEWTSDPLALAAFNRFGSKLREIGKRIEEMNREPRFKNRNGPVMMPYSLLSPYSERGITAKGIPNSISI